MVRGAGAAAGVGKCFVGGGSGADMTTTLSGSGPPSLIFSFMGGALAGGGDSSRLRFFSGRCSVPRLELGGRVANMAFFKLLDADGALRGTEAGSARAGAAAAADAGATGVRETGAGS